LGFLLTALLWGGTNPFIKRGSEGLPLLKQKYEKSAFPLNYIGPIVGLILTPAFIVPSLVNFLGTVSYYRTLSHAGDLGLAVPLANSLTFVITFLTGRLLGEETGEGWTWIGLVMVVIGIAICVADKQ
jgi:drug/metabolite transporter (DMT)-like permease